MSLWTLVQSLILAANGFAVLHDQRFLEKCTCRNTVRRVYAYVMSVLCGGISWEKNMYRVYIYVCVCVLRERNADAPRMCFSLSLSLSVCVYVYNFAGIEQMALARPY